MIRKIGIKFEIILAKLFWIFNITHLLLKLNQKLNRIPILCYHSIESRNDCESILWHLDMAVSPETFEEQIKELSKIYRCVTVNEILNNIKKRRKGTSNLLGITFDDGYKNNYEVAVPILRKYNAKATLFLVGSHLSENKLAPVFFYNKIIDEINYERKKSKNFNLFNVSSYHKKVRQLKNLNEINDIIHDFYSYGYSNENATVNFITPDEAIELDSNGFEIGSHGYYHIKYLVNSDYIFYKDDAQMSLKSIQHAIKKKDIGFAYPFGRPLMGGGLKHNEIIKKLGYSYAVSTYKGLNNYNNDLYCLKRISMEEIPIYLTLFRITGFREILLKIINNIKLKR